MDKDYLIIGSLIFFIVLILYVDRTEKYKFRM